jgi:hypothetical protein
LAFTVHYKSGARLIVAGYITSPQRLNKLVKHNSSFATHGGNKLHLREKIATHILFGSIILFYFPEV